MRLIRLSHTIPLNELTLLLCDPCLEKLSEMSFKRNKGMHFVECNDCEDKVKELCNKRQAREAVDRETVR